MIYARAGVELDRSTLADWVGSPSSCCCLGRGDRPPCPGRSGDPCRRYAGAGARPGRGRTKTGQALGSGAGRAALGIASAAGRLLRYSADRKGEHAEALLGSCRGFLHADAYAGFGGLYEPIQPPAKPGWSRSPAGATRGASSTTSIKRPPRRSPNALERIAELFAIEKAIRGQPPDRRLAVRQERARPLLDELKRVLDTSLGRISSKSSLAQAIRYATSRWDALSRFITDGRLEMSNNAAERAIRPLALGRKNYLFAGADAGGERAAVLYTIIETAKLNGLDPEAYLADILARIADHPAKRIDQLLPWRWTVSATTSALAA